MLQEEAPTISDDNSFKNYEKNKVHFRVGVNCSNCDCSKKLLDTFLLLLDTVRANDKKKTTARQCRAVVIFFATVKCKSSIFFI